MANEQDVKASLAEQLDDVIPGTTMKCNEKTDSQAIP